MSVLIRNPFVGKEGYNCFGCSPDNPNGLGMQFHLEGHTVTCEWTPKPDFEGWVNVLHGGIQATLMDEIAGWLVLVELGTAGVTAKMEIQLLKPAYMNKAPFRLKAVLTAAQGKMAVIHVELTDNSGLLCAAADMHYYTWPEPIAREKMFYPGKEFFFAPENV